MSSTNLIPTPGLEPGRLAAEVFETSGSTIPPCGQKTMAYGSFYDTLPSRKQFLCSRTLLLPLLAIAFEYQRLVADISPGITLNLTLRGATLSGNLSILLRVIFEWSEWDLNPRIG